MPGWHKKIEESGADVVQLGLIQEQHPDRCKLFMQWKQMDWPVMVDSLNLLGVKVVPYTLFIDEHGIIQRVKPEHEFLEKFLETDYPEPQPKVSKVEKPEKTAVLDALSDFVQITPDERSPELRAKVATNLFLWGGEDYLGEATHIFWNSIDDESPNAEYLFRWGVALRNRYDTDGAGRGDFKRAVEAWERSLDLDPNHYIRRRRIQQYGPRLAKPYSFYDWVNTAREEIKARGDTPVELRVEPGGAEFAHPKRKFESNGQDENPDPDGKIKRDFKYLVEVDSVPVPGTIGAGEASRVHVTLRVNDEESAHWNNESGDSVVWIDAPEGWKLDRQLWTLTPGEVATSTEDRKIEFEVRAPEDADPGEYTLKAYALYYVREGVDGTCLYLRQDFEVTLTIRE